MQKNKGYTVYRRFIRILNLEDIFTWKLLYLAITISSLWSILDIFNLINGLTAETGAPVLPIFIFTLSSLFAIILFLADDKHTWTRVEQVVVDIEED